MNYVENRFCIIQDRLKLWVCKSQIDPKQISNSTSILIYSLYDWNLISKLNCYWSSWFQELDHGFQTWNLMDYGVQSLRFQSQPFEFKFQSQEAILDQMWLAQSSFRQLKPFQGQHMQTSQNSHNQPFCPIYISTSTISNEHTATTSHFQHLIQVTNSISNTISIHISVQTRCISNSCVKPSKIHF